MSILGKDVEPADGPKLGADRHVPKLVDTDPLAFLVAPTSRDNFMAQDWEKRPQHIKATADRKKLFDGLFNYDQLLKLVKPGPDGEPILEFEVDINAARYKDGARETPNGMICDDVTVRELYDKEGCTFQLHQPQRFVDPLWRLLAALEGQLGCLVGCNAYLTPAGTQGLAPHHDDVEIFVCQTEGTKRWRLYKPLDGYELPHECSGDLEQGVIGEPVLDVVLHPGDVLYLPRGTIHQAVAQDGGSCHLTISTYQKWSYSDLLAHTLEATRTMCTPAEHIHLPLSLRKGLPLGHLFNCGLKADVLGEPDEVPAPYKSVAASLAQGLRDLAAQIEEHPQHLISIATDYMTVDYFRSRLPPHPAQLEAPGPEPTLDSTLTVRGNNLFTLMPYEVSDSDSESGSGSDDEDEDEEDEEDDDEETSYVRLVTCVDNDRLTHMMPRHDHHHHGHGHVHSEACGHGAACGHAHHKHEHGHDHSDDSDGEEEGSGSDDDVTPEELANLKAALKRVKGHKGGDGKEEEDDDDVPDLVPMKKGKGKHDHSDSDEDDEDDEDGMSDDDSEQDMDDDGLSGPVLSTMYAQALAQILAATEAPGVKVSDLKLPLPEHCTPEMLAEAQLELARQMYSDGFVSVHAPGASSKGKGKGKGAAEGGKAGGKGGKGAKEEMKEKEEPKAKEEAKGKGKGRGAAAEEKAQPPAKKAKK